MATGFPDWLRAMALLGKYGTAYKVIAVDEDGNLNIYMQGEDGDGDFHMVAVDDAGQIIMVPRGQSGNYMNVNAFGYLTAVMVGDKGLGALRPVKVDDDGQMIMVPRGQSGNYMNVNAFGYLTAVMMGDKGLGALRPVKVDDDGQMIMVPRGESGNYMAVDASGFLTTLIKGWDGAAYQTLKVDTDGKINAFIYDTQDAWGQINTVGLSEMAARLGSPMIYERSGQVSFMETFDKGLSMWREAAVGGGGGYVLDPSTYCTGGYSCKVTSGSAVGGYTRMTLDRGLLPVAKIGFTISYAFPGNFSIFSVKLTYYSGTTYKVAQFRLNDDSDDIEIWKGGVGYYKVGDWKPLYRNAGDWSTAKLVVNFATGMHDRLRVNAVNYDISAHSLGSWGSGTAPRMIVEIQLTGRDNQNDVCYIDDFIVTFAEP